MRFEIFNWKIYISEISKFCEIFIKKLIFSLVHAKVVLAKRGPTSMIMAWSGTHYLWQAFKVFIGEDFDVLDDLVDMSETTTAEPIIETTAFHPPATTAFVPDVTTGFDEG